MVLDIHVFGEFRKFAENSKVTDDSVIYLPFKENETVEELIRRIGIEPDKTGELLVNFVVAELDTVIPKDGMRVAIFPLGMHLLCGASHLKGHSFTVTKGLKIDYYGKPELEAPTPGK
ncbi:MAG: MoaD/ThiS family protein [Candidatus Kariarchaeaceae archaeon]|jgi:hypothetical protein